MPWPVVIAIYRRPEGAEAKKARSSMLGRIAIRPNKGRNRCRITEAHPWTKKLWIYDIRTNKDFTLKTNLLKREDLNEFVQCYNPDNRQHRIGAWSGENPEGRWRSFDYEELINRDKVSLDIFWLKDRSSKTPKICPTPAS
jgi:hypothetical protein